MMLHNPGRILFEMRTMAQQLPQFLFYEMGNETFFQGWHTISTNGLWCVLKLVLPTWYPDQMPRMFVVSPITLWKYDGTTINSEGVSHAFHTLGNGPEGCVQICHFKSDNWDASKTCVGIFFKGILFLEAYGVHLATGITIADILEEWKRRQKWETKKTGFDKSCWTWEEVKTLGTSWLMTR